MMADEAILSWLMEGDPAIRWRTLQDLAGGEAAVVEAERARVAREGWGAQLLAMQNADGTWGDGVRAPRWNSTLCAAVLLWQFGLDPRSPAAVEAAARLRERVTWGAEFGDSPFFEGEVEPCINERVLGLGAYFGHASERLLRRLLSEQLEDGGWNCEAERGSVRSSFHSTICVLEGLLEYERSAGGSAEISGARRRAHEYMLERGLYRRRSTGGPIKDRKGLREWNEFVFPTTWHYDVLRGADYFRAAEVRADPGLGEAMDMIGSRRSIDGRWAAASPHHDPVGLTMEEPGAAASRWNTLRAMRVLRWREGS